MFVTGRKISLKNRKRVLYYGWFYLFRSSEAVQSRRALPIAPGERMKPLSTSSTPNSIKG